MSARTRSSFASSRFQLTIGTVSRRRTPGAPRRAGLGSSQRGGRWGAHVSRVYLYTARGSPADPRGRGLAVRLLPRDDGVAQDADALDLGLDHVARLQVERCGVLAEAGDAADGA